MSIPVGWFQSSPSREAGRCQSDSAINQLVMDVSILAQP